MFDVTVKSVVNEISTLIPTFATLDLWRSIQERRDIRYSSPKLPNAIGVINGTSIEIHRPKVEPQHINYSGHRRFHAIHAQGVISTHGILRFVQCGFLGHQNDA